MTYRKFAADQLFTGSTVLVNNEVLITDEEGAVIEIIPAADAGDDVEKFEGIICPGFINSHCHLELSHLKGRIPPDTGMVKFLMAVMSGRNVPLAQQYEAMQAQEENMKKKGIVAVGDICNTDHTLEVKRHNNLYYHNFIEVTGFINSAAASRFAQAEKVFASFNQLGQRSSIVPHAPYSVSDKLFELVDEFDKYSILSIHNQESEAESEFFMTGKGGFLELYQFLNVDIGHFTGAPHNSLLHCLQKISTTHPLILVHNVHTSEKDLQWIAANSKEVPELYWCLCPNANVYIGGKLPNVPLLRKYDCRMVVGTDSLASNDELDILAELKTLQQQFPSVDTFELLQWATVNGAKALKIEDRYGSFAVGKRPGVVSISGGKSGTLAGSAAERIL
jgi:cytosine/adenosine deaminase-related metal-dependent hydrolase